MENFTPYELAVKLKEKGFRVPCIARITPNNTIRFNNIFDNDIKTIIKCHNRLNPYVDAPTISQVLKWLREERDVVVSVNPYYGKFVNVHWWWDIRTPVYKVEICSNIKQEGFESYELAALAGIEYVLDNNLI